MRLLTGWKHVARWSSEWQTWKSSFIQLNFFTWIVVVKKSAKSGNLSQNVPFQFDPICDVEKQMNITNWTSNQKTDRFLFGLTQFAQFTIPVTNCYSSDFEALLCPPPPHPPVQKRWAQHPVAHCHLKVKLQRAAVQNWAVEQLWSIVVNNISFRHQGYTIVFT